MANGTNGDDYLFNFDAENNGLEGNDVIISRVEFGNVTLFGGPGNDYVQMSFRGGVIGNLSGGEGDDWVVGSTTNDLIDGDAGNDLLLGTRDDQIPSGDDQIWGGTGTDGLYGYDGDDKLFGEADDDGPTSSNPDGTMTIDINAGLGAVFQAGLYGGRGNDWLDGGLGKDLMVGGAGDDIYFVSESGDKIVENAGEGYDTVVISPDFKESIYEIRDGIEALKAARGDFSFSLLGNGADNLLVGNDGSNQMQGGAGNDVLRGGGGQDVLFGQEGLDRLEGGAGDDFYYLLAGDAEDIIVELADQGNDSVYSRANYTLAPGVSVERLFAYDPYLNDPIAPINLTGNELFQAITGNASKNVLDGGVGPDFMGGSGGDDTYIVDDVGDLVMESAGYGRDTVMSSISYELVAEVENLILTGTGDSNGTGNVLHNMITGNADKNTLVGRDGNDSLTGGEGNDRLSGGSGTDTAIYSGKRSDYTVTVDAGSAAVLVTDKRVPVPGSFGSDGADKLFDIEKLKFADGTITAPQNQAPTAVALSRDTINENAKVGSAVGRFSATDPEGGKLTYSLTDTAGGLFALAGTKLVTAKALDYESLRKDTVSLAVTDGVTTIAKTFTIAIGDVREVVDGTAGNNTLKGGIGADKIVGHAGNDRLYGAKGIDDLYGGTGADAFLFKTVSDLSRSATATDTINDFRQSQKDLIDLSEIDANLTFIGTSAFHKAAGEVRYAKTGTDTYVYGDTNGDAKTDFALHLVGAITLQSSDFLL